VNKDNDEVVIVSTKRTPIGQYLGSLLPLSAPQLGSIAIKATLQNIDISSAEIEEVIMGCVLSAGIGQAPARQSSILAGIPKEIGATTVNKMCGSGMKAIMIAHDQIKSGNNKILMAGGMESMSNAPYLLSKARVGYRMGHATTYDHMFLDGLEDAYDKGRLMGYFAELCAEKYEFSRQAQDEFALRSLSLAQNAANKGYFNQEITPISYNLKGQTFQLNQDELPLKATPEKIPLLKPSFKEGGTITAANSSGISDGASAHLLMSYEEAKSRHLKPLATIKAHASSATDPAWFTTAPVSAIQGVLQKAGWKSEDVDLFEINEAFAVVTLATVKSLGLPLEKVNIHGGACALGHPIGASGARILTTLIYALKQNNLKRGVAAICIGGGEATAMAIEINE
jgi:acetyl-CoA C-acetyltransferase